MKAIIEKKRYDTDTAERVAHESAGFAADHNHWTEELYLTPNGAWFLLGTGGPASAYAVHHNDGSRSGGKRIVPISAERAQNWLEKHDHIEVLEERFGEQIIDA